MNSKYPPLLVSAAALLCAPLAEAHPLAAHGTALAAFLHPFGGVDHLLAMLLVGLWAGRAPAGTRSLAPLGFLGGLAAGALLGASGLVLPGGETGIAFSLLLLGPLAARATRLPATLTFVCCVLAGLCHGHAHGAELGAAGVVLLAFMAGSTLLHAGGFALARVAVGHGAARAMRRALDSSALAGLWLLAAG